MRPAYFLPALLLLAGFVRADTCTSTDRYGNVRGCDAAYDYITQYQTNFYQNEVDYIFADAVREPGPNDDHIVLNVDQLRQIPAHPYAPDETFHVDAFAYGIEYVQGLIPPTFDGGLYFEGSTGNVLFSLPITPASQYCKIVPAFGAPQDNDLKCSFDQAIRSTGITQVQWRGTADNSQPEGEFYAVVDLTSSPSFVPEPSTYMLIGFGLIASTIVQRNRGKGTALVNRP